MKCDNNCEVICVLFILITTVSNSQQAPLSYLYVHLSHWLFPLIIEFSPPLLLFFVYEIVFYIKWTELEWCSDIVNISCIMNSDNAIPPMSHCSIINKIDGRLVTDLHQKPLQWDTTWCFFSYRTYTYVYINAS